MKIPISLLSLFLLIHCAHAAPPTEAKLRKWTRADGKTVTAKLIDILDDQILLKARGRLYAIPLSKLSAADQTYIKSVTPVPPAGIIKNYPAKYKNKTQKKFVNTYNIKSLAWKDEEKNAILPFLLYVPEVNNRLRKMPLIIHLCGTGGIGKDNSSQLFHDAGGVAKIFFSKKLQGSKPCCIMLPQPSHRGSWYSASFTEPSSDLQRTIYALQHLINDPTYPIDPDRIYITGLSMGGAGVYQALAKFPDTFAAGIPVSYVDNPIFFNKKNAHTPIWVAFNKSDQSLETYMVFKRTYKKLNGEIRTSIFTNGGHNAWDKMLGSQKFKSWLFRKKRSHR